jgi:hypothetical protein
MDVNGRTDPFRRMRRQFPPRELYVVIAGTASGVKPYGGRWWTSWLAVLSIAVTASVGVPLMGRAHSPADFIADMVGAAAGAFVMLTILRAIHGVWERRTLGR